MNRIDRTFDSLRAAGRKGLVGYLTAGDPDAAQSERHVRTALECGVDVLELGVPFSDPTADGPTIQEASQRALAAGMRLPGVLELVRSVRRDFEQPIVLFGYANPFFSYGYERLSRDAARAGVDGLLVVDLPFEERDELHPFLRREGLALIPLLAPTTPLERARVLLADVEGFVYYIMVRGVTGERRELASDAAGRAEAIRALTRLPVAAGFGVSDGAQAARVAGYADAVVVGSALVKAAHEDRLAEKVREIRAALDRLAGNQPGARNG